MSKTFNIYKNDPQVYSEYIDTLVEQRNFRCVAEKISKYNGITDAISLLDLCCGPFTIKPYLIEMQNKHYPSLEYLEYTGVDINKDFIKYAKRNSNSYRLRATFIHADASKITLPHKYNTIIATSAYHHIEDQRKPQFIDNIIRHSTNDGVIIIYEKFISKHSTSPEAIKSGMIFYAERILDILKEQDINPNQAFGLANEMYLTAVRDQEYKITYEEFVDFISKKGLKIIEEEKLWPKKDRFDDSYIGDFVLVLKNNKRSNR